MTRRCQKLRLFLIVAIAITYSERLVVGIYSFRSIIVVVDTLRPLSKQVVSQPRHHDPIQRLRKVESNEKFFRRRLLYNAASDILPNDSTLDTTVSSSTFTTLNFNNNNVEQYSDDDDSNDNVATLRSVTFSNLPKDQEPNLLCELLMEYGACASWITDADRYTEFEEPIFHEPSTLGNNNNNNNNILEDMLSIPWITPVWNQCNVTALFPASIHIPTTIAAIREIYTDIVVVDAIIVEDDNNTNISMEEMEIDECEENQSGSSDDNKSDTRLSSSLSSTPSTSSPSELLGSYSIETVPNNKDWVLSVQQSWHPIIINDCFILRFPWHTDHDVTTAMQQHYSNNTIVNDHQALLLQKEKELIPILLQGGIAFGTGEHATTQLCLQWLHDTVTQILVSQQQQQPQETTPPSSIRVLDYGTGSGILGIAACAMGQKEQQQRMKSLTVHHIDDVSPLVTAIGIDIDIDACRIANANAILNGNVSMRSYLPSFHNNNNIHDDESQSLLMKAHYNYQQQQQQQQSPTSNPNSVVALDDIVLSDPSVVLADESFDICVANILAGPLIVLASTLYNYLRPGSWIGMSGILLHQGDMIVETYQNVGFINVRVHDTMNGWVLVTGQRPIVL